VTITGNSAYSGGGMYIYDNSTQFKIINSIIAYNSDYNVFLRTGTPPMITYSDIYNGNENNHNLPYLAEGTVKTSPMFLVYDINRKPTNLHLQLNVSSCINTGDSAISDVDNTQSDMGAYGGPGGDGFDRDMDGYYDYFWPDTIDNVPLGFDKTDYDKDDSDPTVH